MTKGSDLQVAALENREVACISPFWERSIPEGVDTDKIEAAFKNGVLNVTLPKKNLRLRSLRKILRSRPPDTSDPDWLDAIFPKACLAQE